MAESTKNPHDGEGHDHGHEPEVNPHEVNPGVSHETRDVNVFQISAFGIGLLLSCIVVVFAMWAMFNFLFHREDEKNASNPAALMMNQRQALPPEPRLQARPRIELKDLKRGRGSHTEQLWLDRSQQGDRADSDRSGDRYRGAKRSAGEAQSRGAGKRRISDNSGGLKQRENAGKDSTMNNLLYMTRLSLRVLLRGCAAILLTACLALAQNAGQTLNGARNAPVGDPLNMKGVDRPNALSGVTIEQRLNSQLPLDATFRDEYGQTVKLGKYFGKRPVVLALVYYECPMLCTQILNGMVRAAKILKFTPGKDYEIVAISFDAREGPKQAMAKKTTYMRDYGHPETADGLAFSDRRSGLDQAGYGSGGIQIQVGRLYRDIRARQRHLRSDAGRKAVEVFLRHRLFAEGHAVRAGAGIE